MGREYRGRIDRQFWVDRDPVYPTLMSMDYAMRWNAERAIDRLESDIGTKADARLPDTVGAISTHVGSFWIAYVLWVDMMTIIGIEHDPDRKLPESEGFLVQAGKDVRGLKVTAPKGELGTQLPKAIYVGPVNNRSTSIGTKAHMIGIHVVYLVSSGDNHVDTVETYAALSNRLNFPRPASALGCSIDLTDTALIRDLVCELDSYDDNDNVDMITGFATAFKACDGDLIYSDVAAKVLVDVINSGKTMVRITRPGSISGIWLP